jgi:hypothetical protein
MGQGLSMGVETPEAYEQVLRRVDCCLPRGMGGLRVILSKANLAKLIHQTSLEISLLLTTYGDFKPNRAKFTLTQKCRFKSYIHSEEVNITELPIADPNGVFEAQCPLPVNFIPTFESCFCTIWTELRIDFIDARGNYLRFQTKLNFEE